MFGSETVAEVVHTALAAETAVTAVVLGRLYNLDRMPSTSAFPALLHYMEAGTYEAAINQPPSAERLRWVVRLLCQGASTDPIRAAAEAMLTTLDGLIVQEGNRHVSITATGEWPLTTMLDGGDFYRQLGCFFQVDVIQGG